MPNFESPKTFNEKLQFVKLYRRQGRMAELADKYLVRLVIDSLGESDILVPLYACVKSFHLIDFDKLPNSFVIKVTHDSGGVFVVHDKSQVDFESLKDKIKKRMEMPYIHGILNGEWHYMDIIPRILIEKNLAKNGEVPFDYKVHCFEGVAKYIHVDIDRFTNHKRLFFDSEWNIQLFTTKYTRSDKEIKRPENLDRMLQIANILSRGFHYCRVDFYEVENKLYFGEVTFFHGNGMEKFFPAEYDLLWGNSINLEGA